MSVKKSEISFLFCYALMYISLFIGDIYDFGGLDAIAKKIRLLVYIIIIIQIFKTKFNRNTIALFVILFSLSAGMAIITKDFYWSILVLFIFSSRDIIPDKIMKISFYLLLTLAITTLVLCVIGILPDKITARGIVVSADDSRHAFGFYHSNVLPLIVLYIELYYVFVKKLELKYKDIIIFMIISMVLKGLCNSRNAFLLSLFFSILLMFSIKFKIKNDGFKRILSYLSSISVIIYSLFSIFGMLYVIKGGIWEKLDNILSGRFRLGHLKLQSTGFHIINLMSNHHFFKDEIVCDNGYIYIMLRYGIVFILFYFMVALFLTRKLKQSVTALVVINIMFLANFIDNDLVDYSVLPFILIAFNKESILNPIKNNS